MRFLQPLRPCLLRELCRRIHLRRVEQKLPTNRQLHGQSILHPLSSRLDPQLRLPVPYLRRRVWQLPSQRHIGLHSLPERVLAQQRDLFELRGELFGVQHDGGVRGMQRGLHSGDGRLPSEQELYQVQFTVSGVLWRPRFLFCM